MSGFEFGALGDTFWFHFASNDTSGSGNDGASAASAVRLGGAAVDAAPVLTPSPSLLSHLNYPAGAYEVAVAATALNGFATANQYGVFGTLTVDSQTPSGFLGAIKLGTRVFALGDTVYFWFASNDTAGSGTDGSTPLADVRLCGAAAAAAPVLSPTPTLLTHASYSAGCHEIAIAATALNGFADASTYAVFCTLLADAQNPTGFLGRFTLGSSDFPGVGDVRLGITFDHATQTGTMVTTTIGKNVVIRGSGGTGRIVGVS